MGQQPPGTATTDDVEDGVKDLAQRVDPRSPGGFGDREMGFYTRAHSGSERSVWYVFLMRGRVLNYHYQTFTFRTVSQPAFSETEVKRKGRQILVGLQSFSVLVRVGRSLLDASRVFVTFN